MSQVKLILTESVHSLGEAGDLVTVKPGYARNFLLAQGKALIATETRVKEFEHHKRVLAEKVAKEMKDFEVAKKHLEGVTLEVSAHAGAEGKLFGSVTSARIGDLLAEKGFEIDRRRITLSSAPRITNLLSYQHHILPSYVLIRNPKFRHGSRASRYSCTSGKAPVI